MLTIPNTTKVSDEALTKAEHYLHHCYGSPEIYTILQIIEEWKADGRVYVEPTPPEEPKNNHQQKLEVEDERKQTD